MPQLNEIFVEKYSPGQWQIDAAADFHISIEQRLSAPSHLKDRLLTQTDPKLMWIAKDGILLITTENYATSEECSYVRVYDVAPLRASFEATAAALNKAGNRQGGGGLGGGTGYFHVSDSPQDQQGETTRITSQLGDKRIPHHNGTNSGVFPQIQNLEWTWQSSLIDLIQSISSPLSRWYNIDGEGGKLKVVNERLVVLQSRPGHEEVADILDQLTLSLKNTDPLATSSAAIRPLHNPIKEFSRRFDRESEQRLNELLWSEKNPSLVFPGETPLTEILNYVSADLSSKTVSPILFVPDTGALEDNSTDLEEVIVKDVELQEGLTTVGEALELILSQTDPELSVVARGGVLVLTTKGFAEGDESNIVRIYDLSRIDQAVANVKSSGQSAEWHIRQIVQSMSSPPLRWFDIDGEGGQMNVVGQRLVVSQSPKGHHIISDCLEQLEQSLNTANRGTQRG